MALTCNAIFRSRVTEHRHIDNRGKTVPLELFFDLVFVFAVTQVTSLLATDLTWKGLVRGLAVLVVLWWGWVGYSWLGSAIDPEEGWLRAAFFAAMAASFVVALATDEAFGAAAATFAIAYFGVRVLQVLVFLVVSAGEADFRRSITLMAPSFVAGPALLVIAAFVHGTPRGALWIAALVVDLGGALVGGASSGWRLSPSHFAERHGLIVIIALGEAIVSVGVGAESGVGVSGLGVVVAVTVIAIAAAFWWGYFDVLAIVAERRLHELTGVDRNRLARDSFSYMHFPLVAGIVLVALAAKKAAAAPTKPLPNVAAVALGTGAALYFVALSLLRWRNLGRPNVQRLVAAAAILALAIPLGRSVSALAGLLATAAVCWCVITYEAVTRADLRHTVRHEADHRTA